MMLDLAVFTLGLLIVLGMPAVLLLVTAGACRRRSGNGEAVIDVLLMCGFVPVSVCVIFWWAAH
jgi:hypothetical protein